MDIKLYEHMSLLLRELEQVLKASLLWQLEPINEQLLASTQPFCCDTLQFEQWLQFVFIPKLTELVTHQLSLPTSIALAPMAEVTLSTHAHFPQIHTVLVRIDQSLSQGKPC